MPCDAEFLPYVSKGLWVDGKDRLFLPYRIPAIPVPSTHIERIFFLDMFPHV